MTTTGQPTGQQVTQTTTMPEPEPVMLAGSPSGIGTPSAAQQAYYRAFDAWRDRNNLRAQLVQALATALLRTEGRGAFSHDITPHIVKLADSLVAALDVAAGPAPVLDAVTVDSSQV